LMDDGALGALKRELLPLARVVTPNLDEAERITGLRVCDERGMLEAARAMREMGARAVLVKGGHLAGGAALDLLDDGGVVRTFSAPRVASGATHGTGCTLSAAIAACLARGLKSRSARPSASLPTPSGARRDWGAATAPSTTPSP
ncbi:MAG: hypothetical protein DMF66_17080, partial [Acidobacteria bacterium]